MLVPPDSTTALAVPMLQEESGDGPVLRMLANCADCRTIFGVARPAMLWQERQTLSR